MFVRVAFCVCVYVCVLLNMCVWLSLSDLLVFTCFHSILLGFTSIFHCLFLVLLFFFFLVVFLPSNSISGFITSLEFNV